MANPYASKPDYAFWRRAVSNKSAEDVDPVVSAPFKILRGDKIATAGSCFAQNIARTLVSEGFQYFVTEPEPLTYAAADENYGVYPARFGNIYSTRQFLQLFERAYGAFEPADHAWRRADGRFVDPFRPQIQAAGFESIEALGQDREAHFGAVRKMFEESDILVFTLGLTETWLSKRDGAAFPVAPGVVADVEDPSAYEFSNIPVTEMVDDLTRLITDMRAINHEIRLVLTVSPVPLIATYEDRHVLVSTTYSKSALRVVAEMIQNSHDGVAYFPSYEIITGPHARSRYYAEDLREVTPAGVAQVMSLFKLHYLTTDDRGVASATQERQHLPRAAGFDEVENATRVAVRHSMRQLQGVICDEESLDPLNRES